ncbi:MAG: hypothetical protein MJK18_04875, partial [Bdellovibrionales bacterium]|nr:hypothetical protein [Bdellovibrionales bacterium]
MNKLFKQLFYSCAVLAFVASCTDAPSNDVDSKTVPVNPNIGLNTDGPNKSFDNVVINSPEVFSAPGETTGELSEAEQQLKKEKLSKTIIYGVGAAGITLDTTFADSKSLLTPPFRGPFSNGVTFYNEELIVVWKNDGDRKAQVIYVSKGYLGKLKVGGKFGDITFQTKFLDYKGDDPIQGAAQLTVDLYNKLENVEDKSYNCLADRNCQLYYGTPDQANMVLVFPGAVFLMAKEEWQMAEVRIIRNVEPGILANNVDLING